MPAFTIRPTAQGNYDQWILAVGATKTVAVSDDSDTTYVRTDGTTMTDSYVLADLPGEAGYIVGSVVWNGRVNKSAGGAATTGAQPLLRYSGTDSLGAALAIDGTITTFTSSFATAPGGGAWDVVNVNGTEGGIRSDWTVQVNCYDIWVTGTYEVSGGGLVFLLSLLGSAIGPGLSLRDIPGLTAALARRTGLVLTRDECVKAIRLWRADPHPRRFMAGACS